MTIDEMIAHTEIRQVLATYFRALDRQDVTLLKTVFHPDATDDHGKGVFTGNAHEMCEWIVENSKTFEMVRQHHLTNIWIDMDGENFANVESYGIVVRSQPDEAGNEQRQLAGGRIVDRFERRDGVWKVLHRVIIIDCVWGNVPNDQPELLEPFADFAPYPNDTSHKLFDAWRGAKQ